MSPKIPIIDGFWLFMPRTVMNGTYIMGEDGEVAFWNYARHQTFRGVSHRHLLRNNNYTVVQSFEQRWSIAPRFTTSLFWDILMTSEKMRHITTGNAPWSVGCGLIMHNNYEELGRIVLAEGSQGFRARLSLGVPVDMNHRWRWR